MIIPEPLKKGDRVALLGGSGPLFEATPEEMAEVLRSLGLEPVIFPTVTLQHGYLAGTDVQRAADINAAFADPSIRGVLTMRGGYGFARLLPLLDFDMIARNPKVFTGYSDVTAMHIALNQNAHLATYHMPGVREWVTKDNPYNRMYIEALLYGNADLDYENHDEALPRKTLVEGKAEGILCGGNLTLLSQSLGTPWEIDTEGKILFIEETQEPWWKVDGMLTQLRNAGKLEQAAGIVFGDWNECGPAEGSDKPTLELEEVLQEITVPCGTPMFMGLSCGHGKRSMSLPLGQEMVLDSVACTLRLKK